jgi:hypothetical protein
MEAAACTSCMQQVLTFHRGLHMSLGCAWVVSTGVQVTASAARNQTEIQMPTKCMGLHTPAPSKCQWQTLLRGTTQGAGAHMNTHAYACAQACYAYAHASYADVHAHYAPVSTTAHSPSYAKDPCEVLLATTLPQTPSSVCLHHLFERSRLKGPVSDHFASRQLPTHQLLVF